MMRLVNADILKKLVELHILLRESMQKVVKLQARYREHRLSIELGIVEAIEQMNAAWSGRREAHAELSGPFGVSAGHERGRLFMADLDKADAVLALAKCLDNSVDPVAGYPKDHLDSPIDECLDQDISRRTSHAGLLVFVNHATAAAGRMG
jgi:hypothetical protein